MKLSLPIVDSVEQFLSS